jgi:putative Mn2+ efflux pump MntP
MWELAVLAVTMGIDNLSVAVGIGIRGVGRREALAVPLLFTAFQTAFPLLGLLAGAFVGGHWGKVTAFAGFGLLIALGLFTVWEALVRRRPSARRVSFLVAALAVSLDSLAIGFTLSFLAVPVVLSVALLGLSALVMTSVGLFFGDRIGRRVGRFAEVLAGVVLALTGVGLILERVLHG